MTLSLKSRYIPLPIDSPTPTLEDLKNPNSTIRQDIASTLIRDVQLILSGVRNFSVNQHDTVYTGLSGGLSEIWGWMNFRLTKHLQELHLWDITLPGYQAFFFTAQFYPRARLRLRLIQSLSVSFVETRP